MAELISLLGEIDELLEADHENVPGTKSALAQFDPLLPDLFREAASLFRAAERSSQGYEDLSVSRAADAMAKLGQPTPEMRGAVLGEFSPSTGLAANPAFQEARAAMKDVLASYMRGVLLLSVTRSYLWAVTDFLRQRVTSAFGYLRNQAEAVGIAAVSVRDAEIAEKWWRVGTFESGRTFHHTHSKVINEELRSLDLMTAYEMGSATSQHVRMASLFRGFEQRIADSHGLRQHELRLAYQELDPKNPLDFFVAAIAVLETQRRVFAAVPRAFPELRDPLFLETRIPSFSAKVVAMHQKLAARYPAEAARAAAAAKATQ